jgi:hypothetical protein
MRIGSGLDMVAVSTGRGDGFGLETYFARMIYGTVSPYGVTLSEAINIPRNWYKIRALYINS